MKVLYAVLFENSFCSDLGIPVISNDLKAFESMSDAWMYLYYETKVENSNRFEFEGFLRGVWCFKRVFDNGIEQRAWIYEERFEKRS